MQCEGHFIRCFSFLNCKRDSPATGVAPSADAAQVSSPTDTTKATANDKTHNVIGIVDSDAKYLDRGEVMKRETKLTSLSYK